MQKAELLLKDCKALLENRIIDCNIGINEGKISIVKKILSGEREIDCSHKLVLPGLIDVHVHFRIPGAEWKADWRHESKAALHGGITTVLDMPNNKPSVCTAELLEEKRKIVARTAGVDFGLHLGASPERLDEILKAENYVALKVYMGSTTGELLLDKEEDQLQAFKNAAKKGIPVMVHAEDEETVQENIKKAKKNNWNDVKFHGKIRTPEAEVKAVRKAIELGKKGGNKLYTCHITSAKSIPFIEQAKKKEQISCAVTPHHLFLSEEDSEKLRNFAKVNPPLRSRNDRKVLWNALNTGIIDIVETDHAPHTEEEKKADYWNAPAGIPGVETMLPLLLDAYNRRMVSIERIVECCCYNPARIFGINGKGFIREGFDADLTVVDLKREWRVDSSILFTKCGWTPFEGRKLKGFVEKTFLRGELRQEEGQVFSGNGKSILEVVE